jgi:hypothetical protein
MRRGRSGRFLMLSAAVASLAGCYVYRAAPTTPPAGMNLVLELNDRGRVGMGDSIGSSAQLIEGVTVNSPDTAYGIRVSRIRYLSGQSNDWAGEQLFVPKVFVGTVRERQFSKSRSLLTGLAISAGVAAFIATRDILGFGSSPKDPTGGKPNEN